MRPVEATVLGVLLVVLVPTASGFGYVTVEDMAVLSPGDTYTFRYYLFGDETVKQTSVTAPESWIIQASPAQTDLSTAAARNIPLGDTYRSAVLATLTVTVPLDAAAGTYRIAPIYAARQTSRSSTLSVQQRQPIPFKVTVRELEAVTRAEKDTARETRQSNERPPGTPNAPTGAITDELTTDRQNIPGDDTRTWYAVGVLAAFVIFQVLWVGYILRRRSAQ